MPTFEETMVHTLRATWIARACCGIYPYLSTSGKPLRLQLLHRCTGYERPVDLNTLKSLRVLRQSLARRSGILSVTAEYRHARSGW